MLYLLEYIELRYCFLVTLTGRFFLNVTLTLVTVALNSSGATLACNADGNSVSKRFESPNLQKDY